MTARLPNDKLDDHLRLSTQEMLYTQLESLVGKLNYECFVVDPGRTFLRHLINLLQRTKTHQTFIRLNKPSRLDLQWWNEFLPSWNGNTAFPISISPNGHRCLTLHSLVATDASSSKGFGAFNIDEWFAAPWLPSQQHLGMAYKELYPIIYPDISGVLRGQTSVSCSTFTKA